MPIYKFYIRGHGWEEKDALLPKSEDLPIDLITVGQMGCTMSGRVADTIISEHWDFEKIKKSVDSDDLIYWTHDDREDWLEYEILPKLEKPKVSINMYSTLGPNLCLGGADDLNNLKDFPTLNRCGLCYWNENLGKLHWVLTLEDKEIITLSEILQMLKKMLQSEEDTISLYWTACMDAQYWSGARKAVSFNPLKY